MRKHLQDDVPDGIKEAAKKRRKEEAAKQEAANQKEEVRRQRANYDMNASDKQRKLDLLDDLPISIRKKRAEAADPDAENQEGRSVEAERQLRHERLRQAKEVGLAR